MAAIFHGVVVASLVFAFDFDRRTYPVVPLKMQATLVTEEEFRRPPPVEVPEPEPEPDTSQQDRARAAYLKADQERIAASLAATGAASRGCSATLVISV